MFQVIARAARFVDEHVQHADAVLETAAQFQALGVLKLVFELHQPQFEQGAALARYSVAIASSEWNVWVMVNSSF